jgi:nucleotide-binding universal stress UspA family protein
MTYASLMVHLELGQSNAALLQLTGELAARYEANVIGIALCQPMPILDGGGGYYAGDLIEQDRVQIDEDIKAAEAEFRLALKARSNAIEWRSTVTLQPLEEMLAREARVADLVITGPGPGPSVDGTRRVAIGAFVVQAGRPVLLVPSPERTAEVPISALDRVFIGWKDTSETRRAIADALPLLKHATHVTVVEVAPEDGMAAARSHLADVEGWLGRHGIAAEIVATASAGSDSEQLSDLAIERRAGLLVAGAYGHSRLREWAFGGVTHDLLLRADRCALMSH